MNSQAPKAYRTWARYGKKQKETTRMRERRTVTFSHFFEGHTHFFEGHTHFFEGHTFF